jgi:EmrB/QacA subfamily drug resistance transporter
MNAPVEAEAAAARLAVLRRAFFQVFPCAAVALILGALDQTIVATALPAIAGELGAVESISWVIVASLIGATVAAPVHGRLGDVFGLKRQLVAALLLTLAGATIAATAPSFAVLIAGRVLMGLGAGGLNTLSMALIGEAVPPRERGHFQGWIAAGFVFASSFGPVAGGWLTEHFGWRAVFLAQIPLGLAGLLLAARLPRRPPRSPQSAFRFDLPGAVLFAAFVAPALIALSQARLLSLAALPAATGFAAAAAIALLLLVWREKRARDPLLPIGMLTEPTIARTNLFTACAHGTQVSLVTFLPIYLITVRGFSPAEAGVLLLPLSLGGGVGGLLAGRTMTRTGWAAPVATTGLAIGAAGLVGVALIGGTLPVWALALLLTVVGFGMGCSYPVSQITVQVAAGPARLGAAAASVQYARTLGAAIGTTLLGAVLFGALAAGQAEVAALFARLVREGPAELLSVLGEAERAALRAGLTEAFRLGFLTAAAMAACGSLIAWRVPVRRL